LSSFCGALVTSQPATHSVGASLFLCDLWIEVHTHCDQCKPKSFADIFFSFLFFSARQWAKLQAALVRHNAGDPKTLESLKKLGLTSIASLAAADEMELRAKGGLPKVSTTVHSLPKDCVLKQCDRHLFFSRAQKQARMFS